MLRYIFLEVNRFIGFANKPANLTGFLVLEVLPTIHSNKRTSKRLGLTNLWLNLWWKYIDIRWQRHERKHNIFILFARSFKFWKAHTVFPSKSSLISSEVKWYVWGKNILGLVRDYVVFECKQNVYRPL